MAIGLMVLGLVKRDKELLGTAVLVAVIGGLRVFASDLFSAHGVPLVLSVRDGRSSRLRGPGQVAAFRRGGQLT
jgi:hypothetical protein